MNKLSRLSSALATGCALLTLAIEAPAQTEEAECRVLLAHTEQPSPDSAIPQLLPNSDAKDVVAAYAALLGCRVIFDAGLTGPVTVTVPPSATKEEALDSIERTLLRSGYGLTDGEGNVLIATGLGKNPRVSAKFYTGIDQLPTRERIVTCVLPLKHRDAATCQQQLTQYIVPAASGYNQCLADEASRCLIVTDTTSGVRKLAKLLSVIDVPASPTAVAPKTPSSTRPTIPRPVLPTPVVPTEAL